MNLLILVVGVIAFLELPVREYPDVDPPIVSVRTVLPGASPETVETALTEPLEQALNGIEGMRTIQSSSNFGTSSIDIEFDPSRDVDVAANDVSNAIQRALGDLPDDAERPVISKAGANDQPIMWLHLDGDRYSAGDRTDLADRIVKTPLQVLPGVSRAIIGGSRRYAMRIWLDPAEMAARGVDASDVRRAVLENNLQTAAGEIEGSARKFTVNVEGQIDDPRTYEQLVIREDGDRQVRIADVGRVELGADNYRVVTRFDREPTVGVGIVRQSRSNELAVSRAVRDELQGVRSALPADVDLGIAVDNTRFVEASLEQVWETLAVSLAIVVLVNLIFLRSATTTTITAIAIPVSVVGTFALMQVLGFSINVLTLLALVLAIGLLVDDSIVVMENIYRRRELGESLLRASINGAREVGFAVIATTVAVVAVLIPLGLMTGNVGRLFREFALTMTAAVAISTFVALTLVPMLCSKYLRVASESGATSRLSAWFERVLDSLGGLYDRQLGRALEHPRVMGLALGASVLGVVVLFGSLPQTLVPTEDRGRILTFLRAPRGSTTAYTDRALQKVEEKLASVPEIEGFFSAVALGGGNVGDTSQGIVFARLAPWGDRARSQQEIVGQLFGEFSQIPDALAFPINPASLGQGQANDVEVIIKSSSAELQEFEQISRQVIGELREVSGLVNVDTDLYIDTPKLDIHFDRERAADVRVPVRAVADTLRLLVSEGPTDEFVMRNRQYDVVMALAPRFRSEPGQLGNLYVRSLDGPMIPLASLVDVRPTVGPSALNHYGLQRSQKFTASLAPSASLGDVLPRVLSIIESNLPSGFSVALGGVSREFEESSGAILTTFALSLIVIYLVLSAQFESFVHPLTVMLSVPLACVGALGTLLLLGHTLNVYSQTGIILLVGLVTKNSILLVDFANQERARGTGLLDSLRAAGHTRFRPILMTSVTSILGAIPLAFALGAGAEGRRAIGAAVVGGLLFSTLFTLIAIPVVHGTVIHLAERLGLNTIPPAVDLELETDEIA